MSLMTPEESAVGGRERKGPRGNLGQAGVGVGPCGSQLHLAGIGARRTAAGALGGSVGLEGGVVLVGGV